MYTDKSETLAHKEERERKLRNYLKSSGQHVPTFTSDVDEYNSNAPPDSEDDETVVEFDGMVLLLLCCAASIWPHLRLFDLCR